LAAGTEGTSGGETGFSEWGDCEYDIEFTFR